MIVAIQKIFYSILDDVCNNDTRTKHSLFFGKRLFEVFVQI